MGASNTGSARKLMAYKNSQSGAIVNYANAIWYAIETIFVIGIFTRGDDFFEGGTIFCTHHEATCGEGLLGNVGIRCGIKHTCPGVMGIAGQAHKLFAELEGSLDDLFALHSVAIPGIEVVGDFGGFAEEGLLFSR